MLIIPKLMATQHPDSTIKVTSREEVIEAIEAFLKYKCDEVMVDYEGKLTPYHQVEWITEKAVEYGIDVGESLILTPRTPRDDLEDISRHIMALTGSLMSNVKAQKLGVKPPVKYIVVPMTESVADAMRIQRRIMKIERLLSEEVGYRLTEHVMVIPLIESVERQVHADAVLEAFHNALVREASIFTDTVRVFLGKSDSALHSGHIASVISLKIALSRIARWSEERMINAKVIIGMGKPPFRGHLAPHNKNVWIREWSSCSTVTVQSALRYDTEYSVYLDFISSIKDSLGTKPEVIDADLEKKLREILVKTSKMYRQRLDVIVCGVERLFERIPSTRDRIPYKKYGRSVEGVCLPRAIKYTAALYTACIPPVAIESIDLCKLTDKEIEALIDTYNGLIADLSFDYSFFNPEVASKYMPKDVVDEVTSSLKKLELELGVEKTINVPEDYWRHAEKIYEASNSELKSLILSLARTRGFLG